MNSPAKPTPITFNAAETGHARDRLFDLIADEQPVTEEIGRQMLVDSSILLRLVNSAIAATAGRMMPRTQH